MADLPEIEKKQLISQVGALYVTPAIIIAVWGLFAELGGSFVKHYAVFNSAGRIVDIALGLVLIVVGVLRARAGFGWAGKVESTVRSREPRIVQMKISRSGSSPRFTAQFSETGTKYRLFSPKQKMDQILNQELRLPVYFDPDTENPLAITTDSGFLFCEPRYLRHAIKIAVIAVVLAWLATPFFAPLHTSVR